MSNTMIQIKGVSFQYTDEEGRATSEEILHDLSLDIKQGEFTAILGHNGCGKSTLAKLMNGILIPTEGTILVKGMDTKDEELLYEIRQNAGMVFQNPDNQIVATIVEEDVAFGPENLGVEPTEIRRRVDDSLRAVGMYDYRMHAPSQLSGGQKQRVAIAGVIAMRPSCIIMDEPTAMLDPQGRHEVMETIKRLRADGITVILITHYMDEAAQAERVLVMDHGKVLLDDKPEKVFAQVDTLKKIGLDVPQATELIYRLNQAGLHLQPEIITEKACAEEILRYFGMEA